MSRVLAAARARPALLVHLATLTAALGLLLYLGRDLWFYYDEWDVVGNHGDSLMAPHNEHWSLLPKVAYAGLYAMFGLRSYLPYLAVVLLLHIGVAHLLWRLLRGEGVEPWLATAAVAVLLVIGAGAENLVWAWQMGFVGSVFFGLLALVLVNRPAPRAARWITAGACLLASLTCSGIGVTMVAVAGLAVLLRHGPRKAISLAMGPALVFLAWYQAFARNAATGQQYVRPDPAVIARFVGQGLTGAVEQGTGLKYLGGVLLLLAVGYLVATRGWRRFPVAVAAGAGAVLLMTVIALGRAQYGISTATSGRYVYIAFALLLPLLAVLLAAIARRATVLLVIAFLVTGWGVVHGGRILVASEARQTELTQREQRQVLAAASLRQLPSFISGHPEPIAAPDLGIAGLGQYVAEGALPGGSPPTSDELYRAMVALSAIAEPRGGGWIGGVAFRPADVVGADGSGCASLAPLDGVVRVPVTGPGHIRVIPDRQEVMWVDVSARAEAPVPIAGPQGYDHDHPLWVSSGLGAWEAWLRSTDGGPVLACGGKQIESAR